MFLYNEQIENLLRNALQEDVGNQDITSTAVIDESSVANAVMVARTDMLICGIEYAKKIFLMVDDKIEINLMVDDGQKSLANSILFKARGNARSILKAERTALNMIQHLSGIATLTNKYVELVKGTKAVILDTRKTIAGLRYLQKYAVICGGGHNHRMCLDDGILIKDNHIALGGGIETVLKKARDFVGGKMSLEIECDTIEQVKQALNYGADIILLDNMDIDNIKEAVSLVNNRVKLEVSGNVNIDNIRQIAETGVDFISIGRITHSAPSVDIGLDIS